MATVTDTKGNKLEAYDLIMTKANAMEIINGHKCLELRSLTDFYIRRFLKRKRTTQDTLQAFETKDIHAVHFHDYNNTWFLDCSVYKIIVMYAHPFAEEFLHAFNSHDLDDLIEENRDKDPDDDGVEQCFCIMLKEIYNTNLCTPDKIVATGGKFGVMLGLDRMMPDE